MESNHPKTPYESAPITALADRLEMVPVLRASTPLSPCPCCSLVIGRGQWLPVHCRVRTNYLRIKALGNLTRITMIWFPQAELNRSPQIKSLVHRRYAMRDYGVIMRSIRFRLFMVFSLFKNRQTTTLCAKARCPC